MNTIPPHATSVATSSQIATSHIYFIGDVYLPAPVRVHSDLPGALIYNLEAPLTRCTRGWPGTVNLRCGQDHGPATFGRRPLAVCLANNHIMDFGESGLAETLTHLEAAGIGYFGAGDERDNCNNPLIVSVAAERLGLLGYVCPTTHPVFASGADHRPGVAPIDLERIRHDMETARGSGATRIVVCLHWGLEEVGLPRPEDVSLARLLADAGAELIIGHHAHCIQPFERHAGAHIFYGLGNAIFPDIDTWSNYDEAGRPGERFRKLQNYWNRPSLGVCYDPSAGTVRVDRLHFDGHVLRVAEHDVTSPRLEADDPASYSVRFARHRFRATWRTKLVNYARRPKVPRVRHLRSLVRILREARGEA